MSRKSRLSRRAFLGYGGASLALVSIPGCKDGESLSSEELDVTDLVATEWIPVQRADDLVNLRIGLYNVQRSSDGRRLICVRPQIRPGVFQPAFLVVELPPQHLQEQTTQEGTTAYLPVLTNLSGESRIALVIPPTIQELAFDVPTLLAALRDYSMSVSANAAPTPGVTGVAKGSVWNDLAGEPRAPAAVETALELPSRLILSPNVFGRWDNATAPVAGVTGRVELWHTRLGTSDGRGRFTDRTTPQRTARALWNRDRDLGTPDPVSGSLDADQRQKLVDQTSGTGPSTVEIHKLILSALGGWLDARGCWPTQALRGWTHKAAMGRDYYVEVAEQGWCYPTRHRFVKITICERKLDAASGGYAILWRRDLIAPLERTCTYDRPFNLGERILRQMPFRSISFPADAIPIDPHSAAEAFVPTWNGRPVLFDLECFDRDGNRIVLHTPIVWVPMTATSLDPIENLYRSNEPRTSLRNQRLWLAESTKPGDTTFEVTSVKLKAIGCAAPAGEAPFHPYVEDVELAVPALRQVAGAAAPRIFRYSETYLANAFGGGNARQLLLELIEPARPIRLNFTAQADAVGGFIAPNLDVQGLSRLAGPVSDVANSALAQLDPSQLFKQFGGVSELLGAKLFGCLDLVDLLGLGDFSRLAPKFVTDAMHELERYQKLAGEIRAWIEGSVQTAGTIQSWLQQVIGLSAADVDSRLTSVRAEVERWIGDRKGDLDALVQQTVAVVDAMLALPGAVGTDQQAGKQAAFDSATGVWTTSLGTIVTELTSTRYLPYAYPFVPGLESTIRDFVAVVRRIIDVTADVKLAIGAFLRGVELARSQQLSLEWRPPIKPWQLGGVEVFKPRTGGGLVLSAVIRGKPQGTAKAGVDLRCGLEKFDLAMGAGGQAYVKLHVDKFEFRRTSGRKPEIDVVFSPKCKATPAGMLEFCGPLAFVQTIKDALPLDGFSDPPDVQIKPTGLTATFSQALPSIGCGVFSLENLAISAGLDVPFVGDAMSFRFAFASREKPFLVSVAMLGGTGFFAIEVNPTGIVGLEAQLEFGAHLSIDLGVASGGVTIMAGLYFRMGADKVVSLSGFLRIRGEVDVLGLISASIELRLQLDFVPATGEVAGSATLVIEVSIGFFSTGVTLKAERRFGGAGASQAAGNAPLAALQPPGPPTFAALMPPASGFWESYCGAFASDHAAAPRDVVPVGGA